MNAMNDPSDLSPDWSADAPPSTFTLRRTGRKAVRFNGWQLVEATGANNGRPVWYDLNLYRAVGNHIVVQLTVCHTASDQQGHSHVWTFASLPEAATWLEAYRVADDVAVPPGLGGKDVALPWAVLQAVQLRQSIDRLEADYHALLSEVFAALDLTDPAEVRDAA